MLADALVHIPAYPDAAPEGALEQVVNFLAPLQARATALGVATDYDVKSNWLAELTGVADVIKRENLRSRSEVEAALAAFETLARDKGVFAGKRVVEAAFGSLADVVAAQARCFDLCIVPVYRTTADQRSVAETVLFHSGRPIIVFHPTEARLPSKLNHIVFAWDGSVPSVRALNEVLPLARGGCRVDVVSVLNEKNSVKAGAGSDAVRHLRAHGVLAQPVEIDAGGRPIGLVLEETSLNAGADLLVMGAYGRTRMSDFILGGATGHVLDRPSLPVMLTH